MKQKILKYLRVLFQNECTDCDGHYEAWDWKRAYCDKCDGKE